MQKSPLVLLKNQDDLLPLERGTQIALLGEFARNPRFQGGGSSHMNPAILDSPLEKITEFGNVVFGAGYLDEDASEKLIDEACALSAGKDAVIVFAGTTEKIESEGYDRSDIKLPAGQVCAHKKGWPRQNENVILVNHSGSAIDFDDVDGSVKSILQVWLPGQAGGSAIARCLFGESNPSGKLSETIPVMLEHNPVIHQFSRHSS